MSDSQELGYLIQEINNGLIMPNVYHGDLEVPLSKDIRFPGCTFKGNVILRAEADINVEFVNCKFEKNLQLGGRKSFESVSFKKSSIETLSIGITVLKIYILKESRVSNLFARNHQIIAEGDDSECFVEKVESSTHAVLENLKIGNVECESGYLKAVGCNIDELVKKLGTLVLENCQIKVKAFAAKRLGLLTISNCKIEEFEFLDITITTGSIDGEFINRLKFSDFIIDESFLISNLFVKDIVSIINSSLSNVRLFRL